MTDEISSPERIYVFGICENRCIIGCKTIPTMPHTKQIILFDLDGTLSDPAIGITNCIRYALTELEQQGIPHHLTADDNLHWSIGPSLRESFAKLLRRDNPEIIERAVALYRERFGTIGLYENELYQGIEELLQELHGAGRKVFLSTSKPLVYAKTIIEHFKIDHYFTELYGSELNGNRSDKRELIAHIVRDRSIVAGEAVVVGDRSYDIDGAHHNQLISVAVSYGYGTAEELDAARPAALAASVAELHRLLLRF